MVKELFLSVLSFLGLYKPPELWERQRSLFTQYTMLYNRKLIRAPHMLHNDPFFVKLQYFNEQLVTLAIAMKYVKTEEEFLPFLVAAQRTTKDIEVVLRLAQQK